MTRRNCGYKREEENLEHYSIYITSSCLQSFQTFGDLMSISITTKSLKLVCFEDWQTQLDRKVTARVKHITAKMCDRVT